VTRGNVLAEVADIALRWARVSGDSQSEADQIPDIDDYCDDRGYLKGKVFEVHGKSAYKGAQDPDWLHVVQAIQDGIGHVVVCWMVDRMDRQNVLHAIPMALAVLDAGGRIEFSEQPECNLDANSPTIDDEIKAFSDRIHAANQESKIKSKRVRKAHNKRRNAGSAIGRPPWGYEIICDECHRPPVRPDCKDHKKIFAPTDTGRYYIPLIFARITNGESLRTVAEWLTAEGVPTTQGKPWNEGYLGNRLIKNPVYYGQRRNAGALETEALVTYDKWLDANAALASRVKTGRSTVVREKALQAPVCGNPECDATGKHPSPMYRLTANKPVMITNMLTGKRERRFSIEKGKGRDWDTGNPDYYYRCTGSGPQRKGCGNMIPVAELDQRVIEAIAEDGNEHVERMFIAGNDRSGEIGKLRQRAMDAYSSGDKALFMKLDAEADELAAIPSVAPHWEDKKTGVTKGAHFATLDAAGRREYISRHVVWAHKDADGIVVTVKAREWG
jgi:DNA invertase Pin-like site-specific DNA recombinase